jgi:hypothetical protein
MEHNSSEEIWRSPTSNAKVVCKFLCSSLSVSMCNHQEYLEKIRSCFESNKQQLRPIFRNQVPLMRHILD